MGWLLDGVVRIDVGYGFTRGLGSSKLSCDMTASILWSGEGSEERVFRGLDHGHQDCLR
jgi:hypothetical protein